MIYIVSIITGLAGGFGGWTAAAMIVAAAGADSGGMAVFAAVGPLAAAAGFVATVALTLYFNGSARTLHEIAVRSLGVVLLTGVLIAGGFALHSAAVAHLGLLTKVPAVELGGSKLTEDMRRGGHNDMAQHASDGRSAILYVR